jgi:hypothetical protein
MRKGGWHWGCRYLATGVFPIELSERPLLRAMGTMLVSARCSFLLAALLVLMGAGAPRSLFAQTQNEFHPYVPSAVETPQASNTLELAPAYGPRLPPAPTPLQRVEIPSPFIGGWEGNPNRFDSVVNSPGTFTIGKPGEIIFCYRPTHIDVPSAKIALGIDDWAKNVALHLGLGLSLPRVDEAGIRTEIYAVTSTQIHA